MYSRTPYTPTTQAATCSQQAARKQPANLPTPHSLPLVLSPHREPTRRPEKRGHTDRTQRTHTERRTLPSGLVYMPGAVSDQYMAGAVVGS